MKQMVREFSLAKRLIASFTSFALAFSLVSVDVIVAFGDELAPQESEQQLSSVVEKAPAGNEAQNAPTEISSNTTNDSGSASASNGAASSAAGAALSAASEQPESSTALEAFLAAYDVVHEASHQTDNEALLIAIANAEDAYKVLNDAEKLSVADKWDAIVQLRVQAEAAVRAASEDAIKVAAINGENFDTLQAAVDAANNGDTVTLLADVTESVTVPTGKSITLNLGGKTLTAASTHAIRNEGTLVVSGGGRVDGAGVGSAAALFNSTGANVNLRDCTFTGSSWYVIKNLGQMSITGASIVQNDSASSAVVNGWYNASNPGANDCGVARSGTANLNIYSASVSGGLNSVKNDDYGILSIAGGSYGNSVQHVILNCSRAEISGGTFTGLAGTAVVYTKAIDPVANQGFLRITGGTFNGGSEVLGYSASNGQNVDIKVSGGSFSGPIPAEFCAAGMIPVQDGDRYTVREGQYFAQVGDEKYMTLAEAIDAAASGATVTLLADIADGSGLAFGDKDLTIDFDGHVYHVASAPVGSAGTETNGMQMHSGSNVTLANGTLVFGSAVKTGIKNYGNLALSGMTVRAEGDIAAVNNCGTLAINGCTISSGANWSVTTGNYSKGVVVSTTIDGSTIDSVALEAPVWEIGGATSAESVTVAITSGNYGRVGIYDWRGDYPGYENAPILGDGARLAISGGTFGCSILDAWCADGYKPRKLADGNYTVAPAAKELATVFPLNAGATRNGDDVIYGAATTLTFTPASYGAGHYYAGIQVVRPDNANNARYRMKLATQPDFQAAEDWGFDASRDLWVVADRELFNALPPAEDGVKQLAYEFEFDWDGDGEFEQAVTLCVREDVNYSDSAALTGSVEALIDGASIEGNTVSYGVGSTLPFAASANDAGRSDNHWWAGIKVTAPAGKTAEATYTVQAPWGDKSAAKSFDANADDADATYCTFWGQGDQAYIDAYGGPSKQLVFTYEFDWDGDGTIDQIVNMAINDGVNLSLDGVAAEVAGRGFATVAEAIESVREGDAATVTLVADATESVTVPAGKNITLDLGGKALIAADTHAIKNEGTLVVTDSLGGGRVDGVGLSGAAALFNAPSGVVTLESGALTGSSWYVVKNLGTMTISGGSVDQRDASSSAIDNGWYAGGDANGHGNDGNIAYGGGAASLTINGGTLAGGMNTIKNDDYGVLAINGGTIRNSVQHAVLNWNEATITGGTFVATGAATTVNCGNAVAAGNACSLAVSGGTYSDDAAKSFLTAASALGEDGSGGFYVHEHVASAKVPTCTDAVTCAVCGEVLVEATGHHWVTPDGTAEGASYRWDRTMQDDGKVAQTCTASHMCTVCLLEESDVAVATEQFTKVPTCTESGTAGYAASFKDGLDFEPQMLEEAEVPALGHEWGKETEGEDATLSYEWAYDAEAGNWTCSAHVQCVREDCDASDIIAGNVREIGFTESTCTTHGYTEFKVSFGNSGISQTSHYEYVDYYKHSFGSGETAYIWGEDHQSMTALRICEDCRDTESYLITTEQPEGAFGYIEVIRTDTCGAANTTRYIAHFNEGTGFATQEDTVSEGTVACEYGEPVFTWSADGKDVAVSRTCVKCGSVESFTWKSAEDSDKYVAASCTTPETHVYVVEGTFESDGKAFKDSYEVQGAMLSHDLDVDEMTCTWAENWHSATLTGACKSCGEEQSIVSTDVSETTTSTCTSAGYRALAAKFDINGVERTELLVDETAPMTELGHEMVATGEPAVDPTCDASGYEAEQRCERCGEVTRTEIPALGHELQEIEGTAVAVTCETAGKDADATCSRCGHAVEGATIPALGHDMQEVADTAKAATCVESGKSADTTCSRCGHAVEGATIPALGHDMQEVADTAKAATCVDTGKEADRSCSRCDHVVTGTVIPATGDHQANIADADCEDEVQCLVCGTQLKAAGQHAMGTASYVRNANHSVTATRSCTDCGHVESYTRSATVTVVPTDCVTDGYTEYRVAFDELDGFETQIERVNGTRAYGHAYGIPTYEWSYDENGNARCTATRICQATGCGHVLEVDAFRVTAHETPATCDTDGYTDYTAEFASADYATREARVTNEGSATGHAWGEWTVTIPAMVGVAGSEQRVCAHDGAHVDTRVIPALSETTEPTQPSTSTDQTISNQGNVTTAQGGVGTVAGTAAAGGTTSTGGTVTTPIADDATPLVDNASTTTIDDDANPLVSSETIGSSVDHQGGIDWTLVALAIGIFVLIDGLVLMLVIRRYRSAKAALRKSNDE